MAKSWADMSKEERQNAGGNKKAYNKSTGQGRYEVGGQLEHKSALYNPESAGNQTNQNNQSTASEAKERAQSHMSRKNEGYATERKYVGPEYGDKRYTAKEADDAGWTPGHYDNYKQYEAPTYDDPNSDEAIAGRQEWWKKARDKDTMEHKVWDAQGRKSYDQSANEGYEQNLTLAERHKQKRMGQQYLKQMKKRGISFDTGSAYGQNNYQFDMNKGVFVPTERTRQNKASGYDNMYMSGVKSKEALGDRYSFIHQTFDPLNGGFVYDPNQD